MTDPTASPHCQSPLPTLTDTEQRLADDMWLIYDYFLRFHGTPPGTHYQWDKAGQLGKAATSMNSRNAITTDEAQLHRKPAEPIRPAKIMEYVRKRVVRNHADGKLLFPDVAAADVCPFDCDHCHGEDCPCDRLGCDGYPEGPTTPR